MEKRKLFKSLILLLLCGLMLFGVFACKEEVDPLEDAYFVYDLRSFDFSDDTERGVGLKDLEELEKRVSELYKQEKLDFAKRITELVGNKISFTKDGFEFLGGEFEELGVLPYIKYGGTTMFSFRFEPDLLNKERQRLTGEYRFHNIEGGLYTLTITTYISFGSIVDGKSEASFIFTMKFYNHNR